MLTLEEILAAALEGVPEDDPRIHRLAFGIASAFASGASASQLAAELTRVNAESFAGAMNRDTLRKLVHQLTTALAADTK